LVTAELAVRRVRLAVLVAVVEKELQVHLVMQVQMETLEQTEQVLIMGQQAQPVTLDQLVT
jgi:hypothetical protein